MSHSDAIWCNEHNRKDARPCGVHTDESYGGPAFDHCWQAAAQGTRSAWQPETDDEFREYVDGQVTALAFLDAIPVRQTWESFQTAESRAALMLEAAGPRGEPVPKDVAAWLTLQAAGPGRTEQAARGIAAGLLAQDRRQAEQTVRVDGVEVDRRLAEGVRVLSDGQYEAELAYEQETAAMIGQSLALGPSDFARLQDGEKITATSWGPGPGRLSEAEAHKAVRRASLGELVREKRREAMLFPGGTPGEPGSGPSRIPD